MRIVKVFSSTQMMCVIDFQDGVLACCVLLLVGYCCIARIVNISRNEADNCFADRAAVILQTRQNITPTAAAPQHTCMKRAIAQL